MKTHVLVGEKRDVVGKKVRHLRKKGLIPANIFGKSTKSSSISIRLEDLEKTYKETGETGLIELSVKGEKTPHHVLVHNVQIHPVTDEVLHADFHEVALKEKIQVAVPLHFIGEAPAASQKLGVLITLQNELEVEALPMDLPENIEVSLESLKEVGNDIKVSDLKIDSKVKVLMAKEEVIARINPLEKVEETVVAAPVAEGETPAETSAGDAAKTGTDQTPKTTKAPEEKKEAK
jgi:large subunit ribosomal protein L25